MKYSLKTRALALLMCLAMLMGMLPGMTIAAEEESALYATVEAYTNATIDQTDPANVVVVVENATLRWDPADSSVGRMQDGWWVGIKVVAPEGADLKNVTYQGYGSDKWPENYTTSKKYMDNADGDGSYIQIWYPVSSDLLEAWGNVKRNVTCQYRFDWDCDGKYEQNISFQVNPLKVKLKSTDGQSILYPNGAKVTSFSGGTITGSQTNHVKVTIDKAEIKWVSAADGKYPHDSGWWVGINVVAPEGFNAEVAKLQTCAGTQWPQDAGQIRTLTFESCKDGTNQVQLWFSLTQDELNTYEQEKKNITHLYRFDWDGDDTYEQDICFEVVPSSKIKLIKAEVEEFSFRDMPSQIELALALELKTSAPEGATVTFEITDGDKVEDRYVAEVSDNAIVFEAAGKVTVTATLAATATHNAKTATLEITGVPVEQDALRFEQNNVTVTYAMGGTYDVTQHLTGGAAELEAVYTVEGDAATLENGSLTFVKAGTVKVTATKEGFPYAPVTTKEPFQLTIELAEPGAAFEKAEVTAILGATESEIPALTFQANKDDALKNGWTYTTDNENVTVSGGKLDLSKLTDTCEFTVTATRAADACYEADSCTYTVKVQRMAVPEGVDCTLAQAPNNAGWSKEPVKIVAPQGWLLSAEGKVDSQWAAELDYSKEGETEAWFYLKNEAGLITVLDSMEVKLDTVKPTGLDIQYQVIHNTDKNDSRFDITNQDVEVTVSAEDATSGIAKLEYSLDGEHYQTLQPGQTTFKVEGTIRKQLHIRATDNAGNDITYSKQTEDGKSQILVIDKLAPEVSVAFAIAEGVKYSENDTTLYADSDVDLVITVKEANFDIAQTIEVTVDGEVKEIPFSAWSKAENTDIWTATVDIEPKVSQLVQVRCSDWVNEEAKLEKELRIDTAAPVVDSITFGRTEDGKVGNIFYFANGAELVLKITDDNFDPARVVASLKVDGQQAEIHDILAAAKTGWEKEENTDNVWVRRIPVDAQAKYELSLTCSDLLHEASDIETVTFVVDDTDPTGSITFGGDAAAEWAEGGITYGVFAGDKLTVTVNAEDVNAGVKEIRYAYTGISAVTGDGLNGNGSVAGAKAEFDLPAAFKGTLSVEIEDLAGRTITLTEGMDEAKETFNGIMLDGAKPAPVVDVKVDGKLAAAVKDGENGMYEKQEKADADSRLLYMGDTTITLTVEELFFYPEDVKVTILLDGVEQTDLYKVENWSRQEKTAKYTNTITLKDSGDYTVEISYADKTGTAMTWTSNEYENKAGSDTYASNEITVDKAEIGLELAFGVNENAKPEEYYNASTKVEDSTITVLVEDRNFDASRVVVTVDAKDANGDTVGLDGQVWDLTGADAWTNVAENTYAAKLPFAADAKYTVKVQVKNLAGEVADESEATFVVDRTKATGHKTEYVENSAVEMLEKLFFAKDKITVQMTVTDATSGVAAVYVNCNVDGENPAANGKDAASKQMTVRANGVENQPEYVTNVNLAVEGETAVLTFDVPANYRGDFDFVVKDRAGNEDEGIYNDGNTVIVDNVNPKVSVAYEGKAVAVVDGEDGKDEIVEPVGEDVRYVYGSEGFKAIVTVTEANFFEENVTITATKDGEQYAPQMSGWEKTGTNEEGVPQYQNTLTFTEDGDYQITVSSKDYSGNVMVWEAKGESGKVSVVEEIYTSNVHTIDGKDPEMTVGFGVNENAKPEEYYNASTKVEDSTITLRVTDRNFHPTKVKVELEGWDANDVKLSENAVDNILKGWNLTSWDAWTPVDPTEDAYDAEVWVAKLPFDKDARYDVKVTVGDLVDRTASSQNYSFTVDRTKAVGHKTEYAENSVVEIVEKLFFAKDKITVQMTVTDITSGVKQFYVYANVDGQHADATDKGAPASNQMVVTRDGKVENLLPYVENVKVTVDGATAVLTFDVPANYRGDFDFKVEDHAGNVDDGAYSDGNTTIVDKVNPIVKIEYSKFVNRVVDGEKGKDEIVDRDGSDVRYIYDEDGFTATITVTEANFFEDNVTITVTKDGKNYTPVMSQWVGTQQHQRTLTFTEEGDYRIKVSYEDYSDNAMIWSSNEGKKSDGAQKDYESNIHTIDKTGAQIKVDVSDPVNTKDGVAYYGDSKTDVLTVTDRNFHPSKYSLELHAWDADGADKTAEVQEQLKGWNLNAWDAWTAVDPTANAYDAEVWQAKLPFALEYNYNVKLSTKDLAENDNASENIEYSFAVDKTVPENLKIDYEEYVDEDDEGSKHYGDKVKVILSAEDETAGMKYFKVDVQKTGSQNATTIQLPKNLIIGYEKNGNGSYVVSGETGSLEIVEVKKEGKLMQVTFEIPAQFRGDVVFTAVDLAHKELDYNDTFQLVVDNIAPRYAAFYMPSRVVSTKDWKDLGDLNKYVVLDSTNKNGTDFVMFYKNDAHIELILAESNFHAEDVTITLTDGTGKDVTGTATVSTWKLVDDANRARYEELVDGKNADIYLATVDIKAEGDYYLKLNYTDRSKNAPVDYISQRIVVDDTDPEITVKYENDEVKSTRTENGAERAYFDKVQTAVITIKEHNFRADDVVVTVTAQDVSGTDLENITDYNAQGKDRAEWSKYEGNWRRVGDEYQLTLVYDADANYTFNISYTDLAGHVSQTRADNYFTVDRSAPEFTVENVVYSDPVTPFQTKVDDKNVVVKYYGRNAEITVTAVDTISAIHHLEFAGILTEKVSPVNVPVELQDIRAELLEEKLNENGMPTGEYTYKFTIPVGVLEETKQFDGTVNVAVYNRAELKTEVVGTQRIVVDSIKPVGNVSYNAPVQTVNGISYYAGNINATININEANFDSDDVQITVTRNGAANPVAVHWNDINPDLHVGTFTLTQEGDYFVNIQYTDKSGNAMTNYTSNELTLDLTAPTIKASAIKANSANKAEPYSFVIEFADINLDVASMKPVLKAVIQENGAYKTTEIDLGTAAAVVAGQTYTYTVADLPLDGLYTLTCEVKDLAANTTDEIQLEDEQLYEQVQFSINRNGSAFGYGDSFTEGLNGQYYVYSVEQDVVLIEVNVDPIENYTVKLNGNDLTEGKDYETEQTSKPGEWSKRTYRIHKDLFEKEGEYNIIVTSTDKADTTAFSDIKNLGMGFVVDQTKPVLTITGLTSGGRYQTDAQLVTLIPTDEGGRLKDLKVTVMDSDGKPLTDAEGNDISVRFEMSGEEMLQFLADNDGKVTFTIPEGLNNGLNNQVRIVCTDCAVNAENETNTYDELFVNVTVSQNQLIIFYANKPLFYGTIAGVLAVLALIVILVNRKKKSKA